MPGSPRDARMSHADAHTPDTPLRDALDAPLRDALDAPLRDALIDSRQRWRALVDLAADFVFETNAWGRFTLVQPDTALGYRRDALMGRPATVLLGTADGFDPFGITVAVRARPAWLRRADGSLACLRIAATPIHDATGAITGVRGMGIDITDTLTEASDIAGALRRGDILAHILARTSREVLAPRMMAVALSELAEALGAQGAGIVLLPAGGSVPRMAHVTGNGADGVLACVSPLLPLPDGEVRTTAAADRRGVLLAPCHTRFGSHGAVVLWRAPQARTWTPDDLALASAAAGIIRMVLEHETIQHDMLSQARTDALTGLLNRRGFMEELARHADRLILEGTPGTLMFVDVDHFKALNDRMGHEVGDKVLAAVAAMLRRTVRPTDLVARLGGDEFAIWLNGADHMTAAERADALAQAAPGELAEIAGPEAPLVSLSIGIATRDQQKEELLDSLIRRADLAMYEVKRHGRGHWRVSLEVPD